jgi:ubiquinol-cytochrome c reductase cytochrome c1 subunit
LIVKSRPYGEDYIYALLTGYETPPEGTELMAGMHWNKYFPGHQIAMAQPITDGQVTYSDGSAASLQQASRDLTQFLAWASEPHMEQRKFTGMKALLFMLVFCGIMYAVKRKVWRDVA